jgi:hypothetical protein
MAVEVQMPIETYWEASRILKEVVYLLASGEPQTEVAGQIRKVYKICSPYVLTEKERIWLVDKANES